MLPWFIACLLWEAGGHCQQKQCVIKEVFHISFVCLYDID